MDGLIARISNFFNLQKTISVSVPGIVMALAFTLLFWPTERLSYRGYSFRPPKDAVMPAVPPVCDDLSRETALESGGNGRMTSADYEAIQERRWRIQDCVRQLKARVIAERGSIAAVSGRSETEVAVAKELTTNYQELAKSRNEMAEEFRRDAGRALSAAGTFQQRTKQAEARIEYYDSLIKSWSDEHTAIVERLKLVNAGEVFADLATKLADRVLYFLALAVALGLLLDPLTRALSNLIYTERRIAAFNSRIRSLAAVAPESVRRQFPELTPMFAIGEKVITREDYDDVRQRHYYVSELTLGLIIPTITLFTAIAVFLYGQVP